MHHAAVPQILSSRTMASSSSSNPPPPAERAAEIVDKLPVTPEFDHQTGTTILGSGLLPTAIAKTRSLVILYKEWAENHIARIKGVLDGARAEHTQAVKDRIDEVGQMKDVVLTQATL